MNVEAISDGFSPHSPAVLMERRVLVTGSRGKLGREMVKRFPAVVAPSRQELDLAGRVEQMSGFVETHKPAVVIHAAALTDVRQCEESRDLAWETNVAGTANLMNACVRVVPDVYFVYISTACVFDGEQGPYVEHDIPYPKNFYALTKLAGELIVSTHERHLIVRTNFVVREPWRYPRAFVDRFGTYLFAEEVASAVADVVAAGLTGVVHIAGEERLSMYSVARVTTPEVLPMTLSQYQGPPVTRDMTLDSVRWKKYRLQRS